MTIYKFKSKVTGDLIMLAPHGNQVMTILGREPAAQGLSLIHISEPTRPY